MLILLVQDLTEHWGDRDDSLVGLGIPPFLGLDEDDRQLKVNLLPGQVFQLAFSHSSEQHGREYPPFLLITRAEEFLRVIGCQEFRQSLLRQPESFNHRRRI